jgi:N-acetylmuramoyl-L-alanine amidase
MFPLLEKNDPKTRMILIALAAGLAVLLIVLLLLMPLLPGTEENPSNATTEQTESYPEELTVSQPEHPNVITLRETVTFAGISDPRETLTINGVEVERQADGSFSYDVALEVGTNTVTLVHKEQTLVYEVKRQALVLSYGPADNRSYTSGETVQFEVILWQGSGVQVRFAHQDIEMKDTTMLSSRDIPEGYALYTGSCALPGDNQEDMDMGTATFTVTYGDMTETFESGKILCLKKKGPLASDPGATPDYGKYINVGSGYIVEVVAYQAETFNGRTRDDFSHTTNVYLPAGTMDYASTELVKEKEFIYAVMRSGQRVYTQKQDKPSKNIVQVVKLYEGQLPDHNEIGFVSMERKGSHTILTLDCLWKAPFYLDILPQEYRNPADSSGRNYSITSFTAEYIDITFCYATQFTGTVQIPADTQVFSSAELISREEDCTLRLYLKKTGSFYGWQAYYNDKGQLCFQFLEPAKVTAAENLLGADLTGVTIMIDPGHGGIDPGTVANWNGQRVDESERNFAIALKLKEELEAAGATVIMTRTTDITLTVDVRVPALRNQAPDLLVSIHHNAGAKGDTSAHGFSSHYYTPFSMLAASKVLDRTTQTGIYEKTHINWHYFFMARQSVCPVVLTENGYMSNPGELAEAVDETVVAQKAHAIALGVADYFLEINK